MEGKRASIDAFFSTLYVYYTQSCLHRHAEKKGILAPPAREHLPPGYKSCKTLNN